MRTFALLVFTTLLLAVAAEPQPEPVTSEPTRTLAARGSALLPCNTDHPAPTPLFTPPPDPILAPVAQIALLLTATTAGPLTALGKAAIDIVNSATQLNIGGVLKAVTNLVPNLLCGLFGCAKQPVTDARPTLENMGAAKCLDSSANATTINSLFYYGGANTTVYLCSGATINLESPVFFSAADQTLTTYGAFSTRAKLVVNDASFTCAVYAANQGLDRVTLSNVEINGNRPKFGWSSNGLALIEMGGNSVGQSIKNVKAYEPRGWSALHALEGSDNQCSGMIITDNQLGPAGNAPSGAAQFRMARLKRGDADYTPGQWADGISLACKESTVTGNTITDATDGGIVIFGAPGSNVKSNTIVAENRVLMGGINAVDYYPFLGNFGDVVVSGNTFNAKSTLMKVGIAAGPSTWGSNSAALKTFGGSFVSNTFTSGTKNGYFGYALSVAGHQASKFLGNNALGANFGGVFSAACQPNMPKPQFSIYNPVLSLGNALQTSCKASAYSLAICLGPGNITDSGVTNFGSF
ncbi:hypothetical protein JCM6882_000566 [Rhodosporidiobolus microsporus]